MKELRLRKFKDTRKSIALIIIISLVMQVTISPEIMALNESQERAISHLVEAGVSSSLEELAKEGLVDPINYKINQELSMAAKELEVNRQSFSEKINELALAYGSFEEMMVDPLELDKVANVLEEIQVEEEVILSAEDFDVLKNIASSTDAILEISDELNDDLVRAATSVRIRIEDIIYVDEYDASPSLNDSRIKTIINEEGQVVVRWQHDNLWMPINGYNLYRVYGNEAELLEAGIGKEDLILDNLSVFAQKKSGLISEDIDEDDYSLALKNNLISLVDQTRITESKLEVLGYGSELQLANHLEDLAIKEDDMMLMSGEETFNNMFLNLMKQVDQEADQEAINKSIVLDGTKVNLEFEEYNKMIDLVEENNQYNMIENTMTIMSPKQVIESQLAEQNYFDSFQNSLLTKGEESTSEEAVLQLQEIGNSRNLINAGVNTDIELASALGLAYFDDIKEISRYGNDYAIYVLQPMHEGVEAYSLEALAQEVIGYSEGKGLLIPKDEVMDQNTISEKNLKKEFYVSVVDLKETVQVLPPVNIEGYAINNCSYIRWDEPINEQQKGMVSGYNIYRKLNDEKTFTIINEAPIVVPYFEDVINDTFVNLEGGVFYRDESVRNGDRVEYKIEALDVFGRVSDLSKDSLLIEKVVKRSLPSVPEVSMPYTFSKFESEGSMIAQPWLNEAFRLNSEKIVLPVSNSLANDCVLFNIYRSEAYGNNPYSQPVLVDSIKAIDTGLMLDRFVDGQRNPIDETTIDSYMKEKVVEDDKTINLLTQKVNKGELFPEYLPGTYYNDTDITEGNYYKYWVSGVDSWGNESPWSQGFVIGYETKSYDDKVLSLSAKVVTSPKIDWHEFIPGYAGNRIVSTLDAYHQEQLMSGEVELLIPEHANYDSIYMESNSYKLEEIEESIIEEKDNQDSSNIIQPSTHGTVQSSIDMVSQGVTSYQQQLLEEIAIGDNIISPQNYMISSDLIEVDADNNMVVEAINSGSSYGESLTQSTVSDHIELPSVLSEAYMNLPEVEQVQYIISYNNEDLMENLSLNVSWYAYQGDNLNKYALYRGVINNTNEESLRLMSKEDVLQGLDQCELIGSMDTNTYLDTPPSIGDFDQYVYIVVVIPEDRELVTKFGGMDDIKDDGALGGWVKLDWQPPTDQGQVETYQIYRVEVSDFENISSTNMENMKWKLLDHDNPYTYYYHTVEQVDAHYYIYKVVPINVWGEEGQPVYQEIRVESLLAPAEPEMLISHSKPGQIDVRFTAVNRASKYNIYRTSVDHIQITDLIGILSNYEIISLFNLEEVIESLQTEAELVSYTYEDRDNKDKRDDELNINKQDSKSKRELAEYNLEELLNYTTGMSIDDFITAVAGLDQDKKDLLIKTIIDKYGVLAVADYSLLNPQLASTIEWEQVGSLEVDGDRPAGQILTYEDMDVEFLTDYYYSVSAANDDLESSLPMPVIGACHKGQAFDPVQNIHVTSNNDNETATRTNTITWDHVTMEGVDNEVVITDYLVGYIVYRSAQEDGQYYQVSSLSKDTTYVDKSAYNYQDYFYKVVAVDVAGLLSEHPQLAAKAATNSTFNQLISIGQDAYEEIALEVSQEQAIQAQEYQLVPGAALAQTEFEKVLQEQTELLGESPTIYSDIDPSNEGSSAYEIGDFLDELESNKEIQIGDYIIKDINVDSLYVGSEAAIHGSGFLEFGEVVIRMPINFIFYDYHYDRNRLIDEDFIVDTCQIQLAMLPFIETKSNTLFTSMDLWIINDGAPNENPIYDIHGNELFVDFESLEYRYTESEVSGYIRSNDGYLLADLQEIYFEREYMSPAGIIDIRKLPVFHYLNYTLYDVVLGQVNLNCLAYDYDAELIDNQGQFPMTLSRGVIETSFGLPTVDNVGLPYKFEDLGIVFNCEYSDEMYDSIKNSVIIKASLPTYLESSYASGSLDGLYGFIKTQDLLDPSLDDSETYIKLIVPEGIGLKVESSYSRLVGDTTWAGRDSLSGEVLLPFFQAPNDFETGTDGLDERLNYNYESGEVLSEYILSLYDNRDLEEQEAAGNQDDSGIDLILGNTHTIDIINSLKENGFVVIDGYMMNQSTLPINITSGTLRNGFIVEHLPMDPTMVGNYDISSTFEVGPASTEEQVELVEEFEQAIKQSFIVKSEDISIDLSLDSKLSMVDDIHWYSDEVWMGLYFHEGSIGISKEILKEREENLEPDQEDENPLALITFDLAKDELMYDTNGFFYQNDITREPGDEMEIALGDGFGGFQQAFLEGLSIDMYNNKFEFSMNGRVSLEVFDGTEVGVRMYMDSDTGLVKASIMPKSFQLSYPNNESLSTKIEMNIYGGYFDSNGAHIDGALVLDYPGELEETMDFNELLIPSITEKMIVKREDLSNGLTRRYGVGYFSQTYDIDFNGFHMETSYFDLYASYKNRSYKDVLDKIKANSYAEVMENFDDLEISSSMNDVSAFTLTPLENLLEEETSDEIEDISPAGPDYSGLDNYQDLVIDLCIYGNVALSDNMEIIPGYENGRFYISDINRLANINYDKCRVEVTTIDGDSSMSGEVKPSKLEEDDGNNLSNAIGKDSLAYTKLKLAQLKSGEALEALGSVDSILEDIKNYEEQLNYNIDYFNSFGESLIIDGKALVTIGFLGAIGGTERKHIATIDEVLETAREAANKKIDTIEKHNRLVDSYKSYVKEYVTEEMYEVEYENGEKIEEYKLDDFDVEFYLMWVHDLYAYLEEKEWDILASVPSAGSYEEQVKELVDQYDVGFGNWDENFLTMTQGAIPAIQESWIGDTLEVSQDYIRATKESLDSAISKYDEMNKYVDTLDSYYDGDTIPGGSVDNNGIITFSPSSDQFVMSIMDELSFLEGTPVKVDGKFGYKYSDSLAGIDDDFYFYIITFGLISNFVKEPAPSKTAVELTPEEKELEELRKVIQEIEDEQAKSEYEKILEELESYIPDLSRSKTQENIDNQDMDGGINLGILEIQNLVGAVGYNMESPIDKVKSAQTGSAMLTAIDGLTYDLTNQKDRFFLASGDAYILSSREKHALALKDILLLFETSGSFIIRGGIYGPDNMMNIVSPSSNNSTRGFGTASVIYDSKEERFSFRHHFEGVPLYTNDITLQGSWGYDWDEDDWMIYAGYPEMIAVSLEKLSIDGGIGFQFGVNPLSNNKVFKMKLGIDWKDDFKIAIVYADVDIHLLVEGGYGPWNLDPNKLEFSNYNDGKAFEGHAAYAELKGSLKGGLDLGSVGKYQIIEFELDSLAYVINKREDIEYVTAIIDNNPVMLSSYTGMEDLNDWDVYAYIHIKYSLDLWVKEYKDSFDYKYETVF